MKNYSFVTYLGTDDFLPGVLALNVSLKRFNGAYGLLILVSDDVSNVSIAALDVRQIAWKRVHEISNRHSTGSDPRNFKCMFTKLRIFEMYESLRRQVDGRQPDGITGKIIVNDSKTTAGPAHGTRK